LRQEADHGRFMSHSVSPPILNVTLLDEEASFGMVRDKVSVVNIEGIHMSGLRNKALSPESRMKLPAALATKANNISERYSLEERKQIAEILLILSAKTQLHAEATGPRVVDHVGCTVFEQNSDFCIV
jgi:hypothetical protein